MTIEEITTKFLDKVDNLVEIIHNVDKNVTALVTKFDNADKRITTLEEISKNQECRIAALETSLKVENSIKFNNEKWKSILTSICGGAIVIFAQKISDIISFLKKVF